MNLYLKIRPSKHFPCVNLLSPTSICGFLGPVYAFFSFSWQFTRRVSQHEVIRRMLELSLTPKCKAEEM